MKLKVWAMSIFVFTLMLSAPVLAQEGGDDYYDDDGYSDPYEGPGDFEGGPPAPDSGGSGRPYVPPPPQRMKSDPAPRGGAFNSDGGGSSFRGSPRSVDDPVEFRLVDPPRYWKPKPRKRRAARSLSN